MNVLITGASSGLGYELSLQLSSLGYNLIIVGRNSEKLEQLKNKIRTNCTILCGDLNNENFLNEVCQYISDNPIDILINNAGMGQYGYYKDYSIQEELTLIKTNIIALDVLMKTYIQNKSNGRIVNISSIASKQVDPLMASYGASKSFVTMLSQSVNYELKKLNSKILIQVCLPGSFSSNFDKNAHVKTSLKQMSAKKMAQLIIKDIFKNKEIIIPGFTNKLAYYFSNFIPRRLMNIIEFNIQKRKS